MGLIANKQLFVRQLDLGTLHLFVLICQSGSIGAAAQQAHLAVSSVSKRIKELESVADVPLLLRHARGVEVTAAGACLLRHARDMLMAAEKLRGDLHEFAQGLSGYVHVFASASAVEQFLPSEIAGFAQYNPQISIDLSQVTSHDVIQAVRQGQADLGICDASDVARDLESRPYRTGALVLVVPQGHALAGTTALCYRDTLDHEQIGLLGSSTTQHLLESAAADAGLRLRQRIKVASLSALCRMVESGLGIGVMPKGALRQIARRGKLQAIALTDPWATRRLLIYAKTFDDAPLIVQRFVDHLLQSK